MMSKWYGVVGFGETTRQELGVWNEEIVEKQFYGDVIEMRRRYTADGQVNDNINLSVKISIIANHFMNQHLDNIKFVEYMGTRWKVTDILPSYPRVTLTLGGVYNVQQQQSPD